MANEILTAAKLYIVSANLPTGALSDGAATQAVNDALRTYSRIFPRDLITLVTGAGQQYDLSALTSWQEEVSSVLSVEFPYDSTALGDNLLADEAWAQVKHPTNGDTLRLLEDSPTASNQLLVRYTGLHADGDATSTVRRSHVGAVIKLAAANMALVLASHAATGVDATAGGAIMRNPGERRSGWDSLATRLRKEAEADLGITTSGGEGATAGAVAPACVIAPIDRDELPLHGYGRLTHYRRRLE